jgi:hypothetical protein
MTPQCPHCGVVFAGPGSASHDAGMRMLLPVGRTGLSITAGYVGLAAIAIFPLAPVAIILGVLAVRDLQRKPGSHGMGRAIFAIVAGGLVSLAVATVLLT